MRSLSERLSTQPGEQPLPRDLVANGQRERILLATEELVAKRGYNGTTIELIAKTARVALTTFYEHFPSKEAAFLAAFDQAVAVGREKVAAAVDTELSWPEQVRDGLRAVLELIVSEPNRARLCLVEAQTAGPAGLERFEAFQQSVVPALRRGRQLDSEAARLPERLEDATAGGLVWIVHHRLVMNEIDRIEALLPDMIEIVLTPYLGAGEAETWARRPQLS